MQQFARISRKGQRCFLGAESAVKGMIFGADFLGTEIEEGAAILSVQNSYRQFWHIFRGNKDSI